MLPLIRMQFIVTNFNKRNKQSCNNPRSSSTSSIGPNSRDAVNFWVSLQKREELVSVLHVLGSRSVSVTIDAVGGLEIIDDVG